MDRLPEWLKKYVGAAEHAHWADCSSRDTYDWMYNAILAFLNAAEADGWVMVPREATPDMIEAAETVLWERSSQTYNVDIDKIAKAYHAMLKAAKDDSPPPPLMW